MAEDAYIDGWLYPARACKPIYEKFLDTTNSAIGTVDDQDRSVLNYISIL